jgi:ubiquitin-like protein Nedd8
VVDLDFLIIKISKSYINGCNVFKRLWEDIEPTDKIYTLKQEFSEKIGIPEADLRLVYNGAPLKEDATLDEQGVEPGSIIFVKVFLRNF